MIVFLACALAHAAGETPAAQNISLMNRQLHQQSQERLRGLVGLRKHGRSSLLQDRKAS
jgi:hypothetical protein